MTASDALQARGMLRDLARAADVRPEAVRRVLGGLEVWPDTYKAVVNAAAALGVTNIPDEAPRAPRRAPPKPCAECERLRAKVEELEADMETQARQHFFDSKAWNQREMDLAASISKARIELNEAIAERERCWEELAKLRAERDASVTVQVGSVEVDAVGVVKSGAPLVVPLDCAPCDDELRRFVEGGSGVTPAAPTVSATAAALVQAVVPRVPRIRATVVTEDGEVPFPIRAEG